MATQQEENEEKTPEEGQHHKEEGLLFPETTGPSQAVLAEKDKKDTTVRADTLGEQGGSRPEDGPAVSL